MDDINKIMRDLYNIDPGFKAYETALRKLIGDLVISKPATEVDASFVRRLRADLMHIDIKPAKVKKAEPLPVVSPFARGFSFITKSTFNSSVFAAFIAIFIVAPLTYFTTARFVSTTQVDVKDVSSTLSQKQQINYKPENAFGPMVLVATSTPSSLVPGVGSTSTASSTGLKPDIQTVAVVPAGSSALASSTLAGASSAALAASSGQNIVYVGGDLPLSNAQGTLLQRTVADNETDLISFLKTLKFDIGDFSSFSGLSVKTLQLSEDEPLGYTVSVDIDSGTIEIAPDESQWQAALDSESPSSLSNSQIIAIATTFLSDRAIDTSNYGAPQIVNGDPSTPSDTVTILFPLILNNQEVYNVDGTPYGLTVQVNTDLQKVTTVKNLTSQTYDASQYSLETDPTKILSYLNAGTSTAAVSSTTVMLSSPQQILVRYVTPQSSSSTSTELFVPALLFPASINSATTTSVIVPLVKTLASTTASAVS
jgi:hypothetical protein